MLHAKMLRYLSEVALAGSIRRAAARLNVASSAVNRQILALEQELGVPLFERMPRKLRLTAAGELLVDHVRQTLREYERVGAQLEALKGVQRGKVSIATTLGLAMGPLRATTSKFLDRHRGVQVEVRALVADAIPNAVLSGEVDLALSYNLPPHPNLRTLLTLEIPIVAVVAPQHPLVERGRVHIAEVAQYPMILPLGGMTIRDLMTSAFGRLSVKNQPVLETNSIEMIKLLVTESPRVTFLNPMDAVVERKRGELVFLDLADHYPKPQTLQIITRERIPPDFIASLFVEQLRVSLIEQVEQLRGRSPAPIDGRTLSS
jgi:DNA-binding transcriptional LysR family regulator